MIACTNNRVPGDGREAKIVIYGDKGSVGEKNNLSVSGGWKKKFEQIICSSTDFF